MSSIVSIVCSTIHNLVNVYVHLPHATKYMLAQMESNGMLSNTWNVNDSIYYYWTAFLSDIVGKKKIFCSVAIQSWPIFLSLVLPFLSHTNKNKIRMKIKYIVHLIPIYPIDKSNFFEGRWNDNKPNEIIWKIFRKNSFRAPKTTILSYLKTF